MTVSVDDMAVLLTGVGKRYDIVSAFAQHATVVAADPNPLAPAQYAAHHRFSVPRIEDPEYVPTLAALCEQYGARAVVPLTDLDLEVLGQARVDGLLPAFVPDPEIARATFDHYEAHLLLERLALPSPPTVLPGDPVEHFPVMVKPRWGSGARSIHRADGRLPAFVPSPEVARATYDKYETHLLLERLSLPSPPTALPEDDLEQLAYPVMVKPRRGSGARSIYEANDAAQARFFADYASEPAMVQRAMAGPELSIDCLGDLQGRCLNAIPRTMIESRGGESIKGKVIDDRELIDLGRRVSEALGVRGPCTVQVFRDREIGLGITDVNTRFGGAFPAPMYAALPGRTYPELIVRMARGEEIEPHVGEFRAGLTFTRYYWQLELDETLQPTGRDIIAPPGPPAPR